MIDKFPSHKASLLLSHNDHRNYYETVSDFYELDHFETEEDFKKCIENDDVWQLTWYPSTPIGSYSICGSSLERVLERAKEIERKETK